MSAKSQCNWPDCATFDERCMVGVNMPCVIEGEGLQQQRIQEARMVATNGRKFAGRESFWIVAVTLAALFAVVWWL